MGNLPSGLPMFTKGIKEIKSSILRRYSRMASSAAKGAVTKI